MDDFDLLDDFPAGFEDALDPQDLVDADFTPAELTAVDNIAHAGTTHWTASLSEIKAAVQQACTLSRNAASLAGEADLGAQLQAALADVRTLPSPFKP